MGKITILGALLLAAKYGVDILRAKPVQRALGALERGLGMRPGTLQWAWWSDRTRVLISMGQAFLMGLLGSLAAGMQWTSAVGAGFIAAVGGKGLHDSGVMPGRRPSPRGPAVVVDRTARASKTSRGLSLETDVATGKIKRDK